MDRVERGWALHSDRGGLHIRAICMPPPSSLRPFDFCFPLTNKFSSALLWKFQTNKRTTYIVAPLQRGIVILIRGLDSTSKRRIQIGAGV